MNKQDFEGLPRADKDVLRQARQVLGIKVMPKLSVPRGYVQDESTGTIYKLETWLRKVRQGLKDAKDGHLAEESDE